MQEWWHDFTVVNAAELAPRAKVFLSLRRSSTDTVQIWPTSKLLQLLQSLQSRSDDELARCISGGQSLDNE